MFKRLYYFFAHTKYPKKRAYTEKLHSSSFRSCNATQLLRDKLSANNTWLFERVGASLDVSDEVIVSLDSNFLRSLDKWRGPGLIAVLGAPRAQALEYYTHHLALVTVAKRIVGEDTGISLPFTERRGIMQFAADLLRIGVEGDLTPVVERFVEWVNRRVWRGFCESLDRAGISTGFADERFGERDIKDPGELTPMPPSAVMPFWGWILESTPEG